MSPTPEELRRLECEPAIFWHDRQPTLSTIVDYLTEVVMRAKRINRLEEARLSGLLIEPVRVYHSLVHPVIEVTTQDGIKGNCVLAGKDFDSCYEILSSDKEGYVSIRWGGKKGKIPVRVSRRDQGARLGRSKFGPMLIIQEGDKEICGLIDFSGANVIDSLPQDKNVFSHLKEGLSEASGRNNRE